MFSSTARTPVSLVILSFARVDARTLPRRVATSVMGEFQYSANLHAKTIRGLIRLYS